MVSRRFRWLLSCDLPRVLVLGQPAGLVAIEAAAARRAAIVDDLERKLAGVERRLAALTAGVPQSRGDRP